MQEAVTIRRLQLPIREPYPYKLLTTPQYFSCLAGKQPDNISNTAVIAIAAFENEQPIGLILASLFSALHTGEIHSVCVNEPYREKGIGTQLFNALEKELRQLKCLSVSMVYEENQAHTPWLEVILKQLNWSTKRLSLHCRFDAPGFEPDWLRRDYRLSAGFKIFPWKELTTREKAKLTLNFQRGIIPASVYPLEDLKQIAWENSLGLRSSEGVIGWIITHRIEPETIRYTALYIQPKYQILGDAIKLLCESIRRQKDSGVRWGAIDINLSQSSLKWIRFVEKRLLPWASSISYKRIAWKDLELIK